MDNVTHTAMGYALARAGPARRIGRGAVLYMIVASNIPDMDVFFGLFFPGPSFLYRRQVTHSVFGITALSMAMAWLCRRWFPGVGAFKLFLLALLGTALHSSMDVCNSYGVGLFYPLSDRRFELSWLFIVDPWIWLALLCPFVFRFSARWRNEDFVERLWRASLAGMTAYILFCGGVREYLMHRLSGMPPADAAEFRYVFPEPLGPRTWRGVALSGDTYTIFKMKPFDGVASVHSEVVTDVRRSEVAAARATRFGERLEWFFKAPVWNVDAATGRITCRDLRFQSVSMDFGRTPFEYEVRSEPEL